MLLADTSVWVDFFNFRETAEAVFLQDELRRNRIAVGDIIIYELLRGFRTDEAAATALDQLRVCPVVRMLEGHLIVQAAANTRRLRRMGITIRSAVDPLIATAAIAGDHILLHNDRDFDHFERHLGLRVLHPS